MKIHHLSESLHCLHKGVLSWFHREERIWNPPPKMLILVIQKHHRYTDLLHLFDNSL